MHPTTLIIGGCRSGKSRHALELADTIGGRRKFFVATCVPQDEEMTARVQRHQRERGADWQTLEVPLELAEAVEQHGPKADIMVVDCLTLWVSNLMADLGDDDDVMRKIDTLCKVLAHPPCPVILVTNEVGTGIVPENPLARRYRDLAGWTNQQVAAACKQMIWMVAGIATKVK